MVDVVSDADLVRRFQRGDLAAFDALVHRFQDRIYRLALVWLYDKQHAPDVCQEVFLRALKGLKGFRFRAAPFTWLYRATRNVCQEFNRRRPTDELSEEPLDPGATAEQRLGAEQAARWVRGLVAALPQRQQEVVVLRLFEELSVDDTARAMGCRPGTVKALLHKAMNKLKESRSESETR